MKRRGRWSAPPAVAVRALNATPFGSSVHHTSFSFGGCYQRSCERINLRGAAAHHHQARRAFTSSPIARISKKDLLGKVPNAEVVAKKQQPSSSSPPPPPPPQQPQERILTGARIDPSTSQEQIEQRRRERERLLAKEADKLSTENERLKKDLEAAKLRMKTIESLLLKQMHEEDPSKFHRIPEDQAELDKGEWHPNQKGDPSAKKSRGQHIWEYGRLYTIFAFGCALIVLAFKIMRLQGELAELKKVSQWAVEDSQQFLNEHRQAVQDTLIARAGDIEAAVSASSPEGGATGREEAVKAVLIRILEEVAQEEEKKKRKLPELLQART